MPYILVLVLFFWGERREILGGRPTCWETRPEILGFSWHGRFQVYHVQGGPPRPRADVCGFLTVASMGPPQGSWIASPMRIGPLRRCFLQLGTCGKKKSSRFDG